MRGRPISQERQIAIELGFRTYKGTPHNRCGTTERYAIGGGCVHCARVVATEQREARKYLKASGAFDVTPQDVEAMELDNRETTELEDAEARRQAAIDDLM
jgi:hypothetical protein